MKYANAAVSVLFSEPKIPQFHFDTVHPLPGRSFSALQRAENSSIVRQCLYFRERDGCFSALQRAENSSIVTNSKASHFSTSCFSALQRAENSSISVRIWSSTQLDSTFQCSSASRKFLNSPAASPTPSATPFQCSSASRKFLNRIARCAGERGPRVSVLFSEPKIPQFALRWIVDWLGGIGFSALQRAENSSMPTLAPASIHISDRDDHASSFLSLPGASP